MQVLLIAVCLLASSAALAAPPFALTVSPLESNDGVARLTWDVPERSQIRLQQSPSADFGQAKTLYSGTDSGTTVTGLTDGDYYFRIGTTSADAAGLDWSDPVRLQVSHHSLARAFSFFAIGVVVFLATLVLVVSGSRRSGGAD